MPHILLKIPSQKHAWSPIKKSKESNGDPFIILYSFLKALLPIAKRRIPAPSRRKLPGQGKEKQKSVLMPANINIDSIISNTPAIIKSHFDAVNIGPSFCYNYIFIRCITCRLTGARAFFALPCPA